MVFTLIFDKVVVKQLKKAGRDAQLRVRLAKMFNDIENKGPNAGELIDSAIGLYEIRSMHPPIRIYFQSRTSSTEILIFEFEMKTSEQKQQKTIDKLRSQRRRG